ncbi:phage holin family protein [Lacinutrix sp. MedPE-SW]|uniref:phage holin family protein n=1 Tax=Lacinutrix sp. MedPE-SW TaxID=1860087 RepID=UPI000912E6CA|nr:phage holin family protein [Lacinutrix sp. MedPE-SW]OIQ23017.1 MAG: hypothetical protein BM549_05710 [Lacinutrix sp. MedPE-SW]
MSVFESINNASTKAVDKSELYLKKTQEFYKLKIFEQLTKSVSMLFKVLAVGGILLIGIFFLAISLSLYIGKILDNYTTGFLIVGFIFLVLAIILFLLRSYINTFVIQKISKTFFKDE